MAKDSLKRLLKGVEKQRARDEFRAKWMAAKYALHPEKDPFDVNVMYIVECNQAIEAARLY